MRRHLIVSVAVAMLAASGLFASPAAAITPKTALVYGDSLTWESNWAIAQRFTQKPGWSYRPHSFPGFSLCDFNAWLAADLAAYQPSVVAVETAGNSTRPCMFDANGNPLDPTSDAFFAKYRSDINSFFKTVTDTGASVVWLTAPPMLSTEWNARIIRLDTIAREVAASYPGVSVSTVPRNQVSNAGAYTATKPCLAAETVTQGCGLPGVGLIWIRTMTGTQTGIHFCPAGLDGAYPYACLPTQGTNYSSGGYRWGTAVANTVVSPPASIRPTVLVAAKAGVEGQPVTFTPSLKYPYSRDLTLCYNTSDGTATVAAGDYTALGNTCFTISAWTTIGPTIAVPTLLETVTETAETLKFNVWGSTTPITGTIKATAGTIKANTT